MKLPLKFLDKKGPTDYYLALILQNEKATSVIFEKEEGAIKYISSDEEFFPNTIEDATTEQFLDTLDKVITSAESSLPANIETHKTIFGLKESWVEDNKIKKEYLEKLKKASDELALEPIGFLIFSESVINLIQKDEGAPVSAILANIGKSYATVSLVKSGKILESKSSEIHQSASYTVDTLLKHLESPENLPARIILLGSEDEDLTQEFIGYSWSKSLRFLHLPQIANLPRDASVKATLLGAATQMGAKVLYDSSEIDMEEKPKKITPEESTQTNIALPLGEKLNKIKEESQKEQAEGKNSLGFVGADESMEYFGFSQEDVAKSTVPKVTEEILSDNLKEEKINEIVEDVREKGEIKTPVPVNALLVTEKIKKFLSTVPAIFSNIKIDKRLISSLKSKALNNKKASLAVFSVLGFLAIAVLFYFFSEKADISLVINSKKEQKPASVTFSPSSQTDVKNGVLAAVIITVSEDGSDTIPTTGTKNIGNPAKGTVTVFNNDTTGGVTFPAGTVITSSNNLNFTMDSSVTVASASGDIFSGTKPGTANVNVTASSIGQEYNLPSATTFTIGQNSNVAAKNDNAFSGGSSKKVNVVSDADIQKLLSDLPKSLEQKAQNDINSKVSGDQIILPQFIDETVQSKSFDKKSGDQADQVTLKGTVNFEAIAYNKQDLLSLAQTLFDTSSVILSKNNLTADAKNIVVEKNKDVTADLNIKAKILPAIDTVSLAKQIAGDPVQKAKNTLLNLNQVASVIINIKPAIFFLPQNLPQDYKKITITVTSN